jgi:hypothetical protein
MPSNPPPTVPDREALMHVHVKGSHRLGARMAMLSTVAAAGLVVAAAAPAMASPAPGTATGASTITLGGKAYSTLQSNGCGTLVATGVNGVTVSVVPKGLKLIFPISGIVTQPDNTDALRIDHSGSLTLENDCYAITLSGLRITNFGLPNQGSEFDLSAVTKSVDDSGRQVIGVLDLSGANMSTVGNKTRISLMNLLTSDEGAEELNELAVGGDGSTGPFTSGEKIGSAKTRVVMG